MMRWLLPPIVFVCFQWSLLLAPSHVLRVTPTLWTPVADNASLALKLPYTRVQAFELGRHAALYASCVASALPGQNCSAYVDAANAAIGPTSRLTPKQLTQSYLRAGLRLEDEDRSIGQQVVGFFNFVNIIWVVSIFGVLRTVGPFFFYIFGEQIAKVLKALYANALVPMHKLGVFELCAYAVAFFLSAQSCRYPVQHGSAAALVGLTGALGFAPAWAYSTSLWAKTSPGKEQEFMALTGALLALSLAPLAIIHASSLVGFFAIASMYVACGFVVGPVFGGFYIGFRDSDAVMRCLLVSAGIVVTLAVLAAKDFGIDMHTSSSLRGTLDPRDAVLTGSLLLAPFALGARVLGNVGYFLALLLCSSKWRRNKAGLGYPASNGLMLLSLVAAAFVGSVFARPSYTNTSVVFFVLWVMQKEMDFKWGGASVAVLFVNFVALYFIAHFLNTHPSVITSIFDPSA
jgi:hypothetical protein